MNTASFEYLLKKVTPLIEKSNTRMRDSIPAAERLALTLRFLATGMITYIFFFLNVN